MQKQETSVCSWKVEEQPSCMPKKALKTEKATRVLHLLRDLCLNGVVPRKTPSHQNFPTAGSIGETRGGKFWDQFDGVRFTQSTPRQASIRRENKGPSLGKKPVKIPHQRSPYNVKIEDRSQGETLGKSDAAAMHGIFAKKYLQAQRKCQNYIQLAQ